MQQIAKRVGLAVLGVVVTLAYWSFTGGRKFGEFLPRSGKETAAPWP